MGGCSPRSKRSPDEDAPNTAHLMKLMVEKEATVEYLKNRVLTLQNRFGLGKQLGGFDELVQDIRSFIELQRQLASRECRAAALERDNAALRSKLEALQQAYEVNLRRSDDRRIKLEHLVEEQEETLNYLNSLVQSYELEASREEDREAERCDSPLLCTGGTMREIDDRAMTDEPCTPAVEVPGRGGVRGNKWGTEIVAPSPHSVEALHETPTSDQCRASPSRGAATFTLSNTEDSSSPELTSGERESHGPEDLVQASTAGHASRVPVKSPPSEVSSSLMHLTGSTIVNRGLAIASSHCSGSEPPRYRHRPTPIGSPSGSAALLTSFCPSGMLNAISLRPVLSRHSSSVGHLSASIAHTAEVAPWGTREAPIRDSFEAAPSMAAHQQLGPATCLSASATEAAVMTQTNMALTCSSTTVFSEDHRPPCGDMTGTQDTRATETEADDDGVTQSSPIVPKLRLEALSEPRKPKIDRNAPSSLPGPSGAPFTVDSAALDCPGAEVKGASGGVMLTFPTSDVAGKIKRSPRLEQRLACAASSRPFLTARPAKTARCRGSAKLHFAPAPRKADSNLMVPRPDGIPTEYPAPAETHSKLAAARDTMKRSRKLEASSTLLQERLLHRLVRDARDEDESPSRPQTARPPRRTSPCYGLSKSVDGVGFPQTARVVRDSTACSVSGPVPETADILDESLRMYLSSPESPQTRYEFEKISKGVYKYGSKRVVIAMKNDKPMPVKSSLLAAGRPGGMAPRTSRDADHAPERLHGAPQIIHFLDEYTHSLVSATAPPSNTIVSIKSGTTDVNVRQLPQMLRNAGHVPDREIASFLETARMTTLEYVHSQVVETSSLTIDSDALCHFITMGSYKLPLQSECAVDVEGKIFGQVDHDLHVNDPDARYQEHLKWMEMGEVWQLALPHVTRKVKVALLDSGIDWNDPDFAPLKRTLRTKSGRLIDGGWNFVTNSSILTNVCAHGTNVCKILAAKGNNSVGVVGVALNAILQPLQVIDDQGSLLLSRFLEAIDMAIDLEVDIISASLGFELSSHDLAEQHLLWNALHAVEENGIILVSAAGNDFKVASDVYPCWFGGPRGICVAYLFDYMWDNRTEAVFNTESNYGDRVDVAAYGTQLVTGRDEYGHLIKFSGTSAAQPIVAGLAAILLSMGIEPTMVKQLMLTNVDPVGLELPDVFPQHIRGGAINALRLVQHAVSLLPSRSRGLRGSE
ncbi:hypothetical protein FOZ61_002158 [Perkinsus olseni]|uniref:subtilisin n=1 Tax=Perkinsus olseni TaxID=32597 RepID=A0A7J6LU05_PEROL|nr:hypothetical protein FOZ61_002158 [Perkinsus olseni]